MAQKPNFNKSHPECAEDEVWITNANEEVFEIISWQTKRKGRVAYSQSGEVLGAQWPDAFPVFVKKVEIRMTSPEALQRLEP